MSRSFVEWAELHLARLLTSKQAKIENSSSSLNEPSRASPRADRLAELKTDLNRVDRYTREFNLESSGIVISKP